jgi:ubiquinone/menaquinone biosynthesis C-methylase UbiE
MDRAFARRGSEAADFLTPYLRSGMRLIDCGCGPGSITVDLAHTVNPGEVVGIDLREEALAHARTLARERSISNVTFRAASVYDLPYPDASFNAAFACALIQHLSGPVEALTEIRRVLAPGGVVGLVDGSSPIVFRYPTNPLLDAWDHMRVVERERRTGRPSTALELRALLRAAGFTRTQAFGDLFAEGGPPAGTPGATRRVAEEDLMHLRGMRGRLALEQHLAAPEDLERMAGALEAWAETPDAFYARPVFKALGWA